jgi:RING finger protein 170
MFDSVSDHLVTLIILFIILYIFTIVYNKLRSVMASAQSLYQRIVPELRPIVEQVRQYRQSSNSHSSSSASAAPANSTAANARNRANQGSEDSRRRSREQNNDLFCPICLSTADYCVESNCGHIFCAQCILDYHERGTNSRTEFLGGCKCPNCRRRIDLFDKLWSLEEKNALNNQLPVAVQLNRRLISYNSKFSGSEQRSYFDIVRDSPTLLSRLWSEATASFSNLCALLLQSRIALGFVIALIYFLIPLDLVPEAVFGLVGLIDDLMVMGGVAVYIANVYRQLQLQRQNIHTRT